MSDMATLGIKIDTADVERATKALDEFARACREFEEAIERVKRALGEVHINIEAVAVNAIVDEAEQNIRRGARTSDHRFRL